MSEEPGYSGPRKITAFQTSNGLLFADRASATQAEWEHQIDLAFNDLPGDVLQDIKNSREALKQALKIAEDGFDAAQFRQSNES